MFYRLQFDTLSGLHDDDVYALFPALFCKRRRILRDDGPGIVVKGDHMLCFQEFRSEERILRPHRVVIPDRKDGIVDIIHLAEELHITKERRIACVVDGRSLFEGNDKSAGDAARHAAAVQRLYHFDRSKVCLVLAA